MNLMVEEEEDQRMWVENQEQVCKRHGTLGNEEEADWIQVMGIYIYIYIFDKFFSSLPK